MTQILQTHLAAGAHRYAATGRVLDSTGRYVRKNVGTTSSLNRFRVGTVSLVDLQIAVTEPVDIVETTVGVKGEAMDATHDATVRTFLIGLGMIMAGAILVGVNAVFSAPWAFHVGMITSTIGALVASGASEKYHRGK